MILPLDATTMRPKDDTNFCLMFCVESGERAFPVDLAAHSCGRTDIIKFARDAKQLGVQYVGLCCGNASHYLRALAEEYGRSPPASKYSPDMSEHFIFGSKKGFDTYFTESLKSQVG